MMGGWGGEEDMTGIMKTHKKTLGDDEYAYTDYRDGFTGKKYIYIHTRIYNMSKLSKVYTLNVGSNISVDFSEAEKGSIVVERDI